MLNLEGEVSPVAGKVNHLAPSPLRKARDSPPHIPTHPFFPSTPTQNFSYLAPNG